MFKTQITENDRNRLASCGIKAEELSAVARLHFSRGEMFVKDGMPLRWLLFPVSGKAKVCLTSKNGKTLILNYYVSGGIIGDIELMCNAKDAYTTLVALTDFVCIGIPVRENRKKLCGNLAFMNRVGKELAEKLLNSTNGFMADALHTARERLCSYILQTSCDGIFAEKLTDTASSVGISYRHLMRLMKELCERKALQRGNNGYRILNRKMLSGFAL